MLGSAQRLASPGAALQRSTGGGAVSCDDHYLMLDIVLPRGHPLVIDDVGRSYRWLAKALLEALEARGAELRAVTPGEVAALPPAERAAARLACFAGTGTYELVTRGDGRKLVGLAQRRRGGAALLQAAAYVAAPRLDVAGGARAAARPRRSACARASRASRLLEEVAPGFADASAAGRGARPVTTVVELRPRGPYHLRMTLGGVRDGTLRLTDGRCRARLRDARRAPPTRASRSAPTGRCRSRSPRPTTRAALDRLRFLLALDDDIAPFLALAERDDLLAGAGGARPRPARAAHRHAACTRSCARWPGSS